MPNPVDEATLVHPPCLHVHCLRQLFRHMVVALAPHWVWFPINNSSCCHVFLRYYLTVLVLHLGQVLVVVEFAPPWFPLPFCDGLHCVSTQLIRTSLCSNLALLNARLNSLHFNNVYCCHLHWYLLTPVCLVQVWVAVPFAAPWHSLPPCNTPHRTLTFLGCCLASEALSFHFPASRDAGHSYW